MTHDEKLLEAEERKNAYTQVLRAPCALESFMLGANYQRERDAELLKAYEVVVQIAIDMADKWCEAEGPCRMDPLHKALIAMRVAKGKL